ncbi:MAG: S9 family peptidase [Ardenticatenaceae bacterium]|nr:S9 family peptidase [Ardenticatenaceae bacterium]
MIRIDSLLSARLFLVPQVVGEQIYFVSDLNGRLSLYRMDIGGSIPEPLLPPHIALQNPHLTAILYHVFPKQGKILLMLDQDGDENYQPMQIPLDGGYPEPIFGSDLNDYRCHCLACDSDSSMVYLAAEAKGEARGGSFRGNLATGELTLLGESTYGIYCLGHSADHSRHIVGEQYTFGDLVFYLRQDGVAEWTRLYGKPIGERAEGEDVAAHGTADPHFVENDTALLLLTALFDDSFSLGYLRLDTPDKMEPVPIAGLAHTGMGELEHLEHLTGNRYLLRYNIDGCSWLYEGAYDEAGRQMEITAVLCGQGDLSNGVLEASFYDKSGDRFILSFSTATTPTQIYLISGQQRDVVEQQTRERLLGLPQSWLAAGEDASFSSFDGLRVSARLYLPSPELGFEGKRPLIYYIHGGPQGQERPDFTWFSMPLIQFLTLNGFAVFVPNVRGSTGYGMAYMKKVDRDWGGDDRLDHVHAMKLLAQDERVDTNRAAVIGRSYGGYMTLTLAGRHAGLWKAAVDMFGPYDLFTFMERIPETWKPYFHVAVGHPEKDYDFLVDRSPKTHLHQLACPMLVIQGKNDPRVIEQESRDVVEQLRAQGKQMEYLMFPDEGHDVLKYPNKVRCYTAITDFFKEHLRP